VVGTVSGTDPDSGDTKSYSFTDSAGGRFAIDSVTGQITVANGSLLNYESAANHSVTVRVTDSGGLTYDETFMINLTDVNEAPTGADATVTTNEDTSHTLTTGNFGFSDVDVGDSLSAVRIDAIPTAGTLTLSGVAVTAGQVITVADITAGNLVFTPAADVSGAGYATFTFSVRDSNNAYDTAPNTLTFDVTAVNDAPVLTANTGSTVAEGGTDTIDSSELAVTDVENLAAQLTYTIGTGPAYGRLELTTAPGVSASTFTQADIAANRLVYVHNGSETTSDNFTFTVSDGAGGTLGPTTMTLTITPVNDTPTITSNGGATTAAINVVENVSAVTIVTGADVDLPAQVLTYSISGGADQALFTINAATGALSFATPPDFEVATDANGDNVCVVQVRVVDSQGASTTQTIQVTVTDVAEGLVPPLSNTPTIPPSLLPTSPLETEKRGQPVTPGRNEPPANVGTPTTEQGPKPTDTTVHPSGEMMPPGTPVEAPVFIKQEDLRRYETAKLEPVMPRWDDAPAPSPFTIIPVEPELSIDSKQPDEQSSLSDVLMAKLDVMTKSLEEAIGIEQEQEVLVARVAAVSGATLSVGFVAWAVRSSALLASCLATLPAWKSFDPLPIVRLSKQERNRRRQATDALQRQEQDEFGGLGKFF
jgi:hypothetical protein